MHANCYALKGPNQNTVTYGHTTGNKILPIPFTLQSCCQVAPHHGECIVAIDYAMSLHPTGPPREKSSCWCTVQDEKWALPWLLHGPQHGRRNKILFGRATKGFEGKAASGVRG